MKAQKLISITGLGSKKSEKNTESSQKNLKCLIEESKVCPYVKYYMNLETDRYTMAIGKYKINEIEFKSPEKGDVYLKDHVYTMMPVIVMTIEKIAKEENFYENNK